MNKWTVRRSYPGRCLPKSVNPASKQHKGPFPLLMEIEPFLLSALLASIATLSSFAGSLPAMQRSEGRHPRSFHRNACCCLSTMREYSQLLTGCAMLPPQQNNRISSCAACDVLFKRIMLAFMQSRVQLGATNVLRPCILRPFDLSGFSSSHGRRYLSPPSCNRWTSSRKSRATHRIHLKSRLHCPLHSSR